MRFLSFTCLVFLPGVLQAQDTTRVLNEVVVQAYRYDRPLNEVPASISVVTTHDFSRFSPVNMLPAVNTLPGVRMEERSPGSYRFSIRGSLLRSPFGVRNVKMYWNGLPLTDAGGNTYLNVVDISAVESMEVIKGPGGSLYGAGTGGVVLFNSRATEQANMKISTLGGSYGLWRGAVEGQVGTEKQSAKFRYAHQQSDGYRQQTQFRRDAANLDLLFDTGAKSFLSASVFYTDLFYGTPGGLTKAQFEADPTQARPATNTLPGAGEQRASVSNKTVYAGLTFDYQVSAAWSVRASVYGSATDFQNPFILNYEKRHEKNAGLRVENEHQLSTPLKWKLTWGGEVQYMDSPIDVFTNDRGVPADRMISDDLSSRQMLFFGQADAGVTPTLFLTVGASVNALRYHFIRTFPATSDQVRNFEPIVLPRIALLKKLSVTQSLYASVSRGFSPPTLAEVRPSAPVFNNDLGAEHGLSYEAGWKGSALKNSVVFNVAAYHFKLRETIVIQRNEAGQEYFVNAGNTRQNGVEALVRYNAPLPKHHFISHVAVWSSYTYNMFRYGNYVKDSQDFSGNKMPGVAPLIHVTGVDVKSRIGAYLNITGTYTDHMPLNDANDEFATPFYLFGARLGYLLQLRKRNALELFAGVDNALDAKYSLGNDLNAAGRRYYNPAAPRNYYLGLRMEHLFSRPHE